MPLERRSNSPSIIRRLVIMLIAALVIKYALAAPESAISATETGEASNSVSEGGAPAEVKATPTFVPSESISADKSISFPTDI